MGWSAHKVTLRLRSPLHVGAGKVGNLQRTRPYVAGRNLWGALTARLARAEDPQGKPIPEKYERTGKRVHGELAFTYFFPTIDAEGCDPLFPRLDAQGNWSYGQDRVGAPQQDAPAFRYHFLSTYASTALDYTARSAQEASLHEVECLPPHTRGGESVYLTGYVFQKEPTGLKWQRALTCLQIGGERGYGWGRVEIAVLDKLQENKVPLFGTGHVAHLDGLQIHIHLAAGQPILAHALAADFEDKACCNEDGMPRVRGFVPDVEGPVEPLVGRETTKEGHFGVKISQARICYAPGSLADQDTVVQIGPYGVWEAA